MAETLTRLTHKIAIQLHLVAESCTIFSSRSKWAVRELLDTPSYISNHSNACCMPRTSHLPWLDHPNHIGWRVQITKLVITEFSSCCFLHFRST